MTRQADRVSPDTPETRIARLDERVASLHNRLEAISEAYAPTNRLIIETARGLTEVEKDLAELKHEFSDQIERRREIVRDLETKLLTCASGVGDLEKRWRQEQEAQAERIRQERQTRNRWIIGLAAGFLCAFGGVWLGSVLG